MPPSRSIRPRFRSWHATAGVPYGPVFGHRVNPDIDRTAPVITPPEVQNVTYCTNPSYTIQYSAADALSGLDHLEAQLNGQTVTAGQVVALPPGESTLRVLAVDRAGRATDPECTLRARYDFSGFTSPPEGGQYIRGQPVPIRYGIADGCAPEQPVANATGTLWLSQNGGEEFPATSQVQPGNTAVYDPDLRQYVYDLDTTDLNAGTWRIRLRPDDGSEHFVNVVVQQE